MFALNTLFRMFHQAKHLDFLSIMVMKLHLHRIVVFSCFRLASGKKKKEEED
jgi:hypothetical protein